MGLCSSCWCFPLSSKKKSVIVSTLVYGLVFLATASFTIFYPLSLFALILYFLVELSLILVVIGIKKSKRGYLTQFKWAFGSFAVLSIVASGLLIALFVHVFLLSGSIDGVEKFRNFIMNLYIKINIDSPNYTLASIMKIISIAGIVIVVICEIFTWNYFISTWDYVKDLIEDIDNEISMMNYEAGNPEFIGASGIKPLSEIPEIPKHIQKQMEPQYMQKPSTLERIEKPQSPKYQQYSRNQKYQQQPRNQNQQYQKPRNEQYSQNQQYQQQQPRDQQYSQNQQNQQQPRNQQYSQNQQNQQQPRNQQYRQPSQNQPYRQPSQDQQYRQPSQNQPYRQYSQDQQYQRCSQDQQYRQQSQDQQYQRYSQDQQYRQPSQNQPYRQYSQDQQYQRYSQDQQYRQYSQDQQYQRYPRNQQYQQSKQHQDYQQY